MMDWLKRVRSNPRYGRQGERGGVASYMYSTFIFMCHILTQLPRGFDGFDGGGPAGPAVLTALTEGGRGPRRLSFDVFDSRARGATARAGFDGV